MQSRKEETNPLCSGQEYDKSWAVNKLERDSFFWQVPVVASHLDTVHAIIPREGITEELENIRHL